MPNERSFKNWKEKEKLKTQNTYYESNVEGFAAPSVIHQTTQYIDSDPQLDRINALEASFNTIVYEYSTVYKDFVEYVKNVDTSSLVGKNYKCSVQLPQSSQKQDIYFRLNQFNHIRLYADAYSLHPSCNQEFISDQSTCDLIDKLGDYGVFTIGKTIHINEPCNIEDSIVRDKANIKDMAYIRPDGALVMYPENPNLINMITSDSYNNSCPSNINNPTDISSITYSNMTRNRADNRDRNDLTEFTSCRIPTTDTEFYKKLKSLHNDIEIMSEKLLTEISNYMIQKDSTFSNNIGSKRANVKLIVDNVSNMKSNVDKEYKQMQKEVSTLEHIKEDLEVKYTNIVIWSSVVLLIAFILIKYM